MSIIIFSKPIHSGKTTTLMQWCKHQKCAGILMPDINGCRKFYNVETKNYFDTECKQPDTESYTSIGKYHFSNTAFNQANDIIINSLHKQIDYLIIDEIGKLELNKKGFYAALQATLKAYSNKQFNGKILLVVRDNLLNDVLTYFNINEYEIITELS